MLNFPANASRRRKKIVLDPEDKGLGFSSDGDFGSGVSSTQKPPTATVLMR
jgi:hypothetical protein